MKQIIFILLFSIFTSWCCTAQTNSAKEDKNVVSPYSYDREYMNPLPAIVRYISDTTVIDSGFIRIHYAMNATDILDPKTYDDLQCLEIGSEFSKYYSLYVFDKETEWTNFLKEHSFLINPKDQDGGLTMSIEGKFQGWSEYLFSEYFKDFSTNELIEYTRMPEGLEVYNSLCSELLPIQNWEIADDTLIVADYLCQKATCRFRGRDYTAWFANDIPINNGPWKFGNLPGLILKVENEEKPFAFECVKIEHHKQKFPMTIQQSFKQYQRMGREKLWKRKKEIQENYYRLAGFQPHEGRTFPKLYPYNPLELE
jgi:GLPGLI family protein